MSIKENEKKHIETLSYFDNWPEKYEYIIEQGYLLPDMNPLYKTKENIIQGCQSTVWLKTEIKDSKLFFHADSNSTITKGIISILIDIFSGNEPYEIINYDIDEFIKKSHLKEQLSPSRANGLMLMIEKIKLNATLFLLKQKNHEKQKT